MIKVNGEELEVTDNASVMDIITEKGYSLRFVAVELNGKIISKDNYLKTYLKDGDKLEIVSFVGGG